MGYHTPFFYLMPTDMFHHSLKNFSEIELKLGPTHLDIWYFSLETEPHQALSLLDNVEKSRRDRFLFEKHRRRFGAAHAMLRMILSRYLHVEPHEIAYETEAFGKPRLSFPATHLQFNLSHSGERAILSVGSHHPNGIDIEIHSERPYLELAENIFSAAEVHFLNTQNEADRISNFFKIWSRKEAFIKANGKGLSYPLTTFTTTPFTENKRIDPLDHSDWKIISFETEKNYEAALCCHPSIENIRYFSVNTLTCWENKK